MNTIDIIRGGGNVERFHTARMITRQNVAQHSYNAALIGYLISCHINEHDYSIDVDPYKVAMHLLVHDISEQATGDIPSFAKRNYPSLKSILDIAEHGWAKDNLTQCLYDLYNKDELTQEERVICKYVDQYECMLTCIEEIKMGNEPFAEIVDRCLGAMNSTVESVNNTPALYEVLSQFTREAVAKIEKRYNF